MTDILSPQSSPSPESGPTPKERMLATIAYAPAGLFIIRAMGETITAFVDTHARQGIILWGVLLVCLIITGFVFTFFVASILLWVPAYQAFNGKILIYPGVSDLSKKLPF